ncbi:granulocyte-macrophage colony-stimulating factor receptor subunit alpha-like isoform X2 [Epinephelus fuscoguttatus]|uniref:granulocyte-macrophage colony-stimulating factor receptor subunit alpha-like isoform X2 n=1 Tax=Epinephelus fuscoguttatus TaxID=293821 RepID=UPI0020D1D01C|nr:granulocyte-macrophage colony-stimulating factor receptor subunit alpha-like isoform X2 [Epinephelus fuscoguttatus]
MELLPLYPILWSGLLVLCASQSETEANSQDVCQLEKIHGDIYPESTSKEGHYVEEPEVNDNFHCLLYPTNTLNCSWSFHTLQKDTQLFVHISICDDERIVCSLNASPGERVGSSSLHLHKHGSHVILRFNLTLHHEWTVYTCAYDMDMIEVLSPPQNISASVKDGDLLVTWDLPHSRANSNPSCFEYQLDMGDQERPRNVTERLSYTEPNANPTCTYSVRMRARKKSDCQEATQWSDWSHAIRCLRFCFHRFLAPHQSTNVSWKKMTHSVSSTLPRQLSLRSQR